MKEYVRLCAGADNSDQCFMVIKFISIDDAKNTCAGDDYLELKRLHRRAKLI